MGHYVIIGGCVFSPVLYAWYKWLDKAFPGNSGKVVMKKVCKYPDPVGSRGFFRRIRSGSLIDRESCTFE